MLNSASTRVAVCCFVTGSKICIKAVFFCMSCTFIPRMFSALAILTFNSTILFFVSSIVVAADMLCSSSNTVFF